jgi:hypothetical protein
MLERLQKYTSFLSILVLVGAGWYEYLFFSILNIDIFTYISFTEIINLFLGSIPLLILVLLAVFCYLFCLTSIFKREKVKQGRDYPQRRKSFKTFMPIFFICFLFYFGPLFLPVTASTSRFIVSEFFFLSESLPLFHF